MSKEELIQEIRDIINSENSGLSHQQRLNEIESLLNQNKDDRTMDKLIESNKRFDEKGNPKKDDRDSYEGGFDSGMWLSTI
jgi:hypothetical protein